MQAVMLSVQPKWCELIANGKKTIEVRKRRPKLETPFKVYIYCTNLYLLISQKNKRLYQKIESMIHRYEEVYGKLKGG